MHEKVKTYNNIKDIVKGFVCYSNDNDMFSFNSLFLFMIAQAVAWLSEMSSR